MGAAVTKAAAVAGNDSSTNSTSAFSVLQTAGLPSVTVNSPPKVNFTVFSDGDVVTGLTASNVSVIMAKLVPGKSGSPDQWQSYTFRTETATATVGPGGKPVLATAIQATTDPKQTDPALLADQLKYDSVGKYYTYTFSTDIKDPTKTNGVVFDPAAIHRVALQLSYKNKAGATVLVNPYVEFTIDDKGNAVPVAATASTHKVVDIASCNECHDKLALHGGGRVDTQYCVLCHNAGTTDANSGNVLDFRTMVHKIHAGKLLKEWFNIDYTIWGFRDSEHDYAEVGFPQTTTNCTKCHDNTKAPQADNWKSVPSRAACGTCHGGIDFATGKGFTNEDGYLGNTTPSGHVGGAQGDDSACKICHSATAIPIYHPTVAAYKSGTSVTKIAMQTSLPAGAAKFDYEISSVTVAGTPKRATVVFRILKDGKPVTFNTYASGAVLITGFTSGPSIYIGYAVPQDSNTAPADFNASGSSSIANLWDGTKGKLTGPDTNGNYTAVLGSKTADGLDIPSTATMVTAFLGYGAFNQTMTDTTKYPNGLSLPAQAVQKVATGYTARRTVVANDKCNNCHEQLGLFKDSSFHSGVRNDATACTLCHTPNRTSSGWSADSNAFIHAIHGASKRTVNYNWHAASATEGYWLIGYPGILKNCETCHVAGSYDFSNSTNSAAIAKALYRTVGTGYYNGSTTVATKPATFDANGVNNNGGSTSLVPPTAAAVAALSKYVKTDNATGYGITFSYTAYRAAAAAKAATSTTMALPAVKEEIDVTRQAASTTLVNSPIANACFSCHDSADAQKHMSQDGGGSIYEARSTALLKSENCLFCHGSGKLVDIKAQHAK